MVPRMAKEITQREKTPRIHVTLGGGLAGKLEGVMELTGLPSMTDAARYAMVRGIEQLAGQLKAVEMVKRMEDKFTPDELLPIFEEAQRREQQR